MNIRLQVTLQRVIGYTYIFLAVVASIYLRFSNPRLSETQLFINYWKDWVTITVLIFSGASILWLADAWKKEMK